jgi:acyl carrier protein
LDSEILEQMRTIAADVLSVSRASVGAESSPETPESWDSVRHLNLMLALEEKFSIQFSPEEIGAMHDAGGIAAVVQSKASASRSR